MFNLRACTGQLVHAPPPLYSEVTISMAFPNVIQEVYLMFNMLVLVITPYIELTLW